MPQPDRAPPSLSIDRIPTPLGDALLVTDDDGRLRAFQWDDHEEKLVAQLRRLYGAIPFEPGAAPEDIRKRVASYFDGEIGALEEIPTATAGTDFQRAVWTALRTIPVGQTMSYGELATRLGKPSAMRAVGMANGANPIGLVVPCHRVIGADGTLTGYGGGMKRKRWLLRHEGARFNDTLFA